MFCIFNNNCFYLIVFFKCAAIDSGDLDGYDEEVVEAMAVNKSFDSFESALYFN